MKYGPDVYNIGIIMVECEPQYRSNQPLHNYIIRNITFETVVFTIKFIKLKKKIYLSTMAINIK